MDYKFLLDIGLIILFVKIFSMITGKIHMPKMLGGLIAGVVLGPAVCNIIQTNTILEFLANLGIIFIMFLAGMETSLKKFMKGTKKFVIIASLGVVIPLLFGFLFSKSYTLDNSLNLFFGVVITATSVSITVESLIEMKKLKTNVGMTILGAGVVDDIIGIVFLTLILNNGDFSFGAICILILKVILFFALAIGLRLYNVSLYGMAGIQTTTKRGTSNFFSFFCTSTFLPCSKSWREWHYWCLYCWSCSW